MTALTRDRWFRSTTWADPAWHLSGTADTAVCGAYADPELPWAPRVPLGHITCTDCED